MLDERLRSAAAEIRDAYAGHRGVPMPAARRRPTRRWVIMAVSAAVTAVVVGVGALALRDTAGPRPVPFGSADRGTVPSTIPSSPTTAPPATTMSVDSGLSDKALLPGQWLEELPRDAHLLLAEDGIGLAAVPIAGPQSEPRWSLVVETASRFDAHFLLTSEDPDGDIPGAVLGLAVDEDAPVAIVFGITPLGATDVRLSVRGLEPLVLDRVFDRPQVDRSAFVGTIELADLKRAEHGAVEMFVGRTAGEVTALVVELYESSAEAGYAGAVTGDTFVGPLPVAGPVIVSELPEVVPCQVPAGVSAPARQGGPAAPISPRETPAAAFSAFLDIAPGDPPIARRGYTEIVGPDGSVHYGLGYEDDIENGLVTLISVTRAADGWVVSAWEASGC